MNFKHFLLTRFNVGCYDHPRIKDPDAWLDNRFRLFNEYTLPSINKQTNKNFTWVICIDANTPKTLLEEKLGPVVLQNTHFLFIKPNFYQEEFTSFHLELPAVRKFVNDNLFRTDFVITSRIDNDDCIKYDTINKIQNIFLQLEKPIIIDFPNGYFVNVETNKAHEKYQISNPYVSVVESSKKFRTVWTHSHNTITGRAKKTFGELVNNNERQWATICHGTNLVNRPDNTASFVSWGAIKNNFL